MKNISEKLAEKLASKGHIEKRYHQTSDGKLTIGFTIEICFEGNTCQEIEDKFNSFIAETIGKEISTPIVVKETESKETTKASSKTTYKSLCKDAAELFAIKEYEQARALYQLAFGYQASNYKEAEKGIEQCDKWIKALQALNTPLTGNFVEEIKNEEVKDEVIEDEDNDNDVIIDDNDIIDEEENEDELIPEVAPEKFQGLYQRLLPEEITEYIKHARENYIPNSPIAEVWHPVYREECIKINAEYNEQQAIESTPSAMESNIEEDADEFLPPPFNV